MNKKTTPIDQSNDHPKTTRHWSSAQEAGTLLGLRFLWLIHKTLGRKMVSVLLLPIVAYFVLFRSASRKASKDFLLTHYHQYPEYWDHKPGYFDVIRHFKEFSEAVVDKLTSWFVELNDEQFTIHSLEQVDTLLNDPRGQLVIGSHMGNLEYCRGFVHRNKNKVINVLLHGNNSQNYTQMMTQLSPDSQLNVYQVDEFNIETVLKFKAKIDAGEWLFIAGDRIPLTGFERTVTVDFFGKKAAFPIGPYMLAKVLACPVKLMFSYIDNSSAPDIIQLEVVDFADSITFDRKDREGAIQQYAQQFASALEAECAKAPFQWFNFYDFWLSAEKSQDLNSQ